jgi:hypothetical protein
MPKQAMDYSKTIIYKIVCNDLNITETYVGHTTNIVKRRCNHKGHCNNEKSSHHNLKIYQTIRANGGWDNWNMVQVCEFPCNNQEEARTEERRYYELLNASLNMINPCRGKREWCVINKETIAEKKKEYEIANKEKRAEQKRVYYEVNKETIAEYYKTNKEMIAERKRGHYQANIDTIKQKAKEHREVNRDEINRKIKIWQEANKERVAEKGKIKYTCCCGSTLRKGEKTRHERTHKHLKYVNTM